MMNIGGGADVCVQTKYSNNKWIKYWCSFEKCPAGGYYVFDIL